MKRIGYCGLALLLTGLLADFCTAGSELPAAGSQPYHEFQSDDEGFRFRLGDFDIRGTADEVQYQLQTKRDRKFAGELQLSGNVRLQGKTFDARADHVAYAIDSGTLTFTARTGNQVQLWRGSEADDTKFVVTGSKIQMDVATHKLRLEGDNGK